MFFSVNELTEQTPPVTRGPVYWGRNAVSVFTVALHCRWGDTADHRKYERKTKMQGAFSQLPCITHPPNFNGGLIKPPLKLVHG